MSIDDCLILVAHLVLLSTKSASAPPPRIDLSPQDLYTQSIPCLDTDKMIINHNGAGPVRVRILKRSGARHRNQYYDEWRLIGDNSRSPEFYIPVEDGDLYAIEITYLQGFDMRPFSHARSSFRQIGHRGAVKMETYHHLRNPEYRAGAEQRLTRDIVHTIYKKAEGKINGANMRDLEFALKELMPGMYP